MEEIIQKIREYVREQQSNQSWVPGKDFVSYAGSYYDENEYAAAVESLLGGWLAMGNRGLRFETVFPKLFGKKHGVLTNSGSSSNLLMMSALTLSLIHI